MSCSVESPKSFLRQRVSRTRRISVLLLPAASFTLILNVTTIGRRALNARRIAIVAVAESLSAIFVFFALASDLVTVLSL